MGEGHHFFQPFHVGGDDGLLFDGILDDRDKLEQLFHVDGAVFHIPAVQKHQLEVGELHPAAVKHIILQCRVVVIGGAQLQRTLHLNGLPLFAVTHQDVDHDQGVVVLKYRFIHHVDRRVLEVFHGLFHPSGKLRGRVGRHVNSPGKVFLGQNAHIGPALELRPLLDAEFVAQIRMFFGHI